MAYALLDKEKVPEVLRNKPRLATCMALATGTIVITMSAITIGMFIGYTYCYIEHRTGIRSGNVTHSTNLQILHVPLVESEEIINNRTMNSAALSSMLVSRIVKLGHALVDEEIYYLQTADETTS